MPHSTPAYKSIVQRFSTEKLAAFLDYEPDAVIVVDSDGIIQYFNRQAESWFGYQRSEILGESSDILVPVRFRLLHLGYRQRYMSNPRKRSMSSRRDILVRRKDETEFPIAIALNPLHIEGKMFIVAVIRDITKQVRMHERMVRSLKREQAAHARADKACLARDEVVATVAHDLKNPLVTILLSAGRLSEKIKDRDAQRCVTVIKNSGARMNRLISDLLDVHRIEAGGLSIEEGRGIHEAGDLMRDAAAAQQALTEEKEIALSISAPDERALLNVNRERIMQVFQNLISNALKFTPKNGTIKLQLEYFAAHARFIVSDSGPGIDPAILPNIFNRFVQARPTATLGSGLGLTIAKGIVEAHGGKIGIESKSGSGATFYFSLPIAAVDQNEAALRTKLPEPEAAPAS